MEADEAADLVADAASVGVSIDERQAQQLVGYLDQLERWNAAYNLTAVRDRASMRVQHLLDCLAVVPPLRRVAGPSPRILDVGSGAGLPGVVIATLCPAATVTCVDAVGKKAAFVRQVAGALGLANLRAEHARVETLAEGGYDVVTARAFSSLADLVSATDRLLSPSGRWMAMKGRRPDEEIAALPPQVEVFHVEPLRIPALGAERCLVWMRRRDGG